MRESGGGIIVSLCQWPLALEELACDMCIQSTWEPTAGDICHDHNDSYCYNSGCISSAKLVTNQSQPSRTCRHDDVLIKGMTILKIFMLMMMMNNMFLFLFCCFSFCCWCR